MRFFDRLWFAASDRRGGAALQFTLGVYQNMNVVDGGFVAIVDGRQHNLRVSRQLRPTYDTACGPLRIDGHEPLRRIGLTVSPNIGRVHGELEWTAALAAQEERRHFNRSWGRVLENYSRYDQIGELSGWLDVDGHRIELDSWWSCRDHSWGVRENVGVPEPVTGEIPGQTGSIFAFLFWSTDTHGGHVQVTRRDGADHLTAAIIHRVTGKSVVGQQVTVDAEFIDDARPRRFGHATFEVTDPSGAINRFDVTAQGSAVAMQGLGYGGYNDGRGLGAYRGIDHVEADVWDVTHPAEVGYPDGTTGRPVHRIQPVTVTHHGAGGTRHGTGSLTFIAEVDLDPDGHLRSGHS